jgi:hypothetical protein
MQKYTQRTCKRRTERYSINPDVLQTKENLYERGRMNKTITYDKTRELTSRILTLQNDLMKAGLVLTFHKMHEVTKQVGWEIAEIIEGKHHLKLEEE